MRRSLPILACVVALALAGCGNRGDLVLPDKAPAEHEPVPDQPAAAQQSARP
mgnify:CR=1 FL=1